ncbi:MAG: pyridoxal-phosphate dependent enzyme [bacterium]|nr:pyridoxal-phosphate dependent enzyme [bacterium]
MLSKKEKYILRSIIVPSEDDPSKPEFPPEHPRFPATPTYKISVPGFSNVWLKDESVNPTGTHKDRMAWEMVVTYNLFLKRKQKENWIKKLPELSLLSSGSAALAIQYRLREYSLPSLRVLMSADSDQRITNFLKQIGCKIFLHPLSREVLTWRDILRLTKNPHGFDVTSNTAFDPTLRFYDWMSYEILASRADYVLVPYGTGQLYETILNIAKREVTSPRHDPRFQSTVPTVARTHFLGATTTNPRTRADKLYAPYLPFAGYNEQWIRFYRMAGFCGKDSQVWNIQELHLDQARKIAHAQKITAEPSGLAGLALLLQLKNQLPRSKKYLIVNTGHTKLPFDLYHSV